MGARGKRSRTKRDAVRARRPTRVLGVGIEAIDVARGHDGLLRGRPEPVVAIGLYALSHGRARFVDRLLVRARLGVAPPARAEVLPPSAIRARVPAGDAERAVALLLVLERDSGADVARIMSALATPEAWQTWTAAEAVPAPLSLSGPRAAGAAEVASVEVVHVLEDGVDLRDRCRADDLVAAALVSFSRGGDVTARAVSPDARNDWVLRIGVELRS